MISYLLDQVPWWLYAIAGLLGTGVLFYFFSPILIPLWNALPTWIKAVLIGIGGAFLAFIYGTNKGNRDAKDLQRKQNAEAVSNRKEIDRDVTNLDEPAADKRLNKWMRD